MSVGLDTGADHRPPWQYYYCACCAGLVIPPALPLPAMALCLALTPKKKVRKGCVGELGRLLGTSAASCMRSSRAEEGPARG